MAARGRVLAAVGLMLVLVVCHFSTAQRFVKRKKAVKPPKRRVAHIVKDLEKNMTALWGKVDMLSQPVHVHVHGDSHLMDHHHHDDDNDDNHHDHHGHGYHVHHHDHDHDHPCDSEDRSSEEVEEEESAAEGKDGDRVPNVQNSQPVMMNDARRGVPGRQKHRGQHGDDDDDEGHKHGHHKHRGKHGDDDDDEGHKHGHHKHRGKHGHDDDDDDDHQHGHHGQHGDDHHGHGKHDHHDHDHGKHHHHLDHHCEHGHEHHHHHDEDEDHEDDMDHHGGHGTHVHIHLHAGGMGETPHQHKHEDVPPAPAKEYRYACCDLYPGHPAPNAQGTVMFRQMPGGPLEVKVELRGFPIDLAKNESVRYLRGMHGHEYGDVRDKCMRQGGHYNPHGVNHGGPKAEIRHPGDFGNVVLKKDGTLKHSFNDTRGSLFGDFSLLGHGLLFHEGADDLGLLDTAASRRSGNAGARAACCAVLSCAAPPGVWTR